MSHTNGLRFVTQPDETKIPERPEGCEVEVTLDYIDFGFLDPQHNWLVLSFIEYAEQEYGNPKYFRDDAREVYMDWKFEDAKWEHGILDIDDNEIRNAIADYLAYERLWNDGAYVHPFAFN
jgi:hypothetical protein